MKKYLFLKRGIGPEYPIDIVEVKESPIKYSYRILSIVVHNDPKMSYVKAVGSDEYCWSCGVLVSPILGINKNKYDKVFEFETDEDAKLYLEVMKDEL